jgi:polysaccharide pyruvyl transferase CsaB
VRIGISGSYGGLNLGDEAILRVLVGELVQQGVGDEYVIFSRERGFTQERYPTARVVAVREIDRAAAHAEVAQLDALVLGGGGVLFDGEASTFLREVELAQELGIPTLAMAVGAGPLAEPTERWVVGRTVSAMTSVSVRSRRSASLLRDCGVESPVEVVADPAWLLPAHAPAPVPLEGLGLPADRQLIAVSVREPGPAAPVLYRVDYHTYLAAGIRHAVRRYDAHVVFVAMEHGDVDHAHRVAELVGVPGGCTVLGRPGDPLDVYQVLRHARLALGLRFHFLLLAASAGVPIVVPPLVEKLDGLADELGLPAEQRPEARIPSLRAALEAAWQCPGAVREAVAEAVRERVHSARRGVDLLMAELVAAPERPRASTREPAGDVLHSSP